MLKKIKNIKSINLNKILGLEKIERQMIYGLVIVLFIVLNFLFSSLSFRLDFSFGKAYTLSKSTKKILKNLDDIVRIKFFASSALPTRLLPLKTEVVDLLKEYDKQGGSKVRFSLLDPKKDQKVADQAKEAGLPELQFSQLNKDKYAVSSAYFGVIIAYGDKKEVLPQVTEVGNLEYNITAGIYKLTRKTDMKIGIMGYKREFDPQKDSLSTIKRILERQFTIDYVDVSTDSGKTTIDNSIKTVLIFDNNKDKYDQLKLDAIKNYLHNNGTALVFADGVWVKDSLATVNADHGLFPLLNDWGLILNKNLLLSTSAEMVNFGNNVFSFLTPYPFWVKTSSLNKKSTYFSNINQLSFPWVSSISTMKKDGLKTRILAKTSKKSWEQKEKYVLDPKKIPQPDSSDLKEFNLISEAEKKGEGKIVLIPSSRFILNRFLSRNNNNIGLVLNTVNNLASKGALTGIRSRSISFYPIPNLTEKQKDMFKYLNILLLPLLFGAFGSLRLMKRK